jgi:hypothetical protein
MTAALRHQCRYCRTQLSEPTDNPRRAFCTRGCHSSFYRSRCLVCEGPIRRKNEAQKFGSGHKVCAAEYRRFPGAYDHLGYPPSPIANEGGGNPHEMGTKTAHSAGRAWCWEANLDIEHQLLAGDTLLARISLRRGRWLMTWPRLDVRLGKSLDAAQRFVEEMFPLHAQTATRVQREISCAQRRYLAMANLSWSLDRAAQSNWKPTGSGADMPDIPAILQHTTRRENYRD